MNNYDNRFRFLLRTDRYREQQYQLQNQFPNRNRLNIYQIQYFLKNQGLHIPETQILKTANKLYGNTHNEQLSSDQTIGLYARLNIDEEVEKDFRNIFYYFSAGQELISASELKNGLQRLGAGKKEREVNSIFKELDLNCDGFISFQIFLQAMMQT